MTNVHATPRPICYFLFCCCAIGWWVGNKFVTSNRTERKNLANIKNVPQVRALAPQWRCGHCIGDQWSSRNSVKANTALHENISVQMYKKNVIWYQSFWYQNDRAKLTAALLWNTREIELYTEPYIVSGREFKRRQRSILSRRGNTLDENQLVWDCLLPRWHWQQKPFISQIGIYPHGLGGVAFGMGCLNSRFYFIFSFKKI